MRVTGAADLWSLGDCALVPNAQDGRPCPATAQFAMEQARQLAENLRRLTRKAATKPFKFRPRGLLANLGHHQAVAVIYGVKLSGFFAWVIWRAVYLAKLPTFKRKLEVALNWAVSIPFPPNIVEIRLEPAPAETSLAGRGDHLP
jgi:NADH dehydrogenase